MINVERELGKVAWQTYAKSVGLTSFDGQDLPPWNELGERQQRGWIDAATEVIKITSSKGVAQGQGSL